MPKPISIRLDDQLAGQLATVATRTDRPKTWHIEQALRVYLAQELAFLEAVEEGLAADAAEDLVEHAVVVAELDAVLATARAERH